jgi:NADPH:quinone reductase-like Zn-dependent oxidoreductase
MQALVTAPGNTAVVSKISIPEPGSNEIRIKVHSVALNPVDPLYVAHPPSSEYGRVVGSDIAGTVDKVGDSLASEWAIGDRVAGLLQGATSGNEIARPGGFAEYAILEADLIFRIPKNISFDEAATFPLCSLTAAQALFIRLRLPSPFPNPYQTSPLSTTSRTPTLLVYSASTSLGLFTVQLAKLVTPSIRVIATASASNHSLLRSLGADSVFDYRSPNWVEDVKKASAGGVDFAVDCISEDKTTGMISRCFVEGESVAAGGEKHIAVIRSVAWDKSLVRGDVTPLYGAVWMGLGHEIVYNGNILPADPIHRAFAVAFYRYLSSSSSAFPVKPNPVRLMPGGLEKIVDDGFVLMGSGKVADRDRGNARQEKWMAKISAEKLVYRVVS